MLISAALYIMGLLLFFGGIVLQILLSKAESRWFGLILPAITFLWSLLLLTNFMIVPDVSLWEKIVTFIGALLYCNISTISLLLIYAICRYRRKIRVRKQSEQIKMDLQDL